MLLSLFREPVATCGPGFRPSIWVNAVGLTGRLPFASLATSRLVRTYLARKTANLTEIAAAGFQSRGSTMDRMHRPMS